VKSRWPFWRREVDVTGTVDAVDDVDRLMPMLGVRDRAADGLLLVVG
jgi:hypothetical protein